MKKRILTSKKHLRQTGDQLWRMAGVKMWGSWCVCGKPADHGHHYYYRSSYGHLRYDLDNFVPLCNGCHFLLHYTDPKKIEEPILVNRGRKWHVSLQKKAQERPQSYQTVDWYKEQIQGLRNYLES